MPKRSVLTIPVALALVAAMAISGSVQAATGTHSPASMRVAGAAGIAVTPAPTRVTVTGQVMLKLANGNFRLSNGKRTFTIVMTKFTHVINLRGREVPRQFIQVANKVTVTGMRTLLKITAGKVLVYTRKDGP